MARTPDPAIRAALVEKALDYVLSHGITDLSLRPLAEAIDTSARMLIYHFGSREALMHAVIDRLREREDALIAAWLDGGMRTMSEFLDWYWQRMRNPRARPAIRLIFELYALALRDPQSYPGVLTAPLDYWRKLARKTGLGQSEATLLLAVTRGLLLDLCATGDMERVDKAMAMVPKLLNR